jgi:hypothetical protein
VQRSYVACWVGRRTGIEFQFECPADGAAVQGKQWLKDTRVSSTLSLNRYLPGILVFLELRGHRSFFGHFNHCIPFRNNIQMLHRTCHRCVIPQFPVPRRKRKKTKIFTPGPPLRSGSPLIFFPIEPPS